jgi:hypothetical protein
VTHKPDDHLLTHYLLRCLSAEETERLDELSIADDDFAARLNSAENDLVDAYVRGELPAEESARFKAAYLSSPKGREKAGFAETLVSFQQRAVARPAAVRAGVTRMEKRESRWSDLFEPSRSFKAWFAPQWRFAGATLLLLIASGYLLNTNRELRQQVSRSESEQASLLQRDQQLQHQLASAAGSNRGNSGTEAHEVSQPSIDHLNIAAFVLVPALRGSDALPTISWSAATDLVVLKLDLESTDFPTYQVAIKNSANRQTQWQSGDLKPVAEGDKQAVSFAFRPNLLKRGYYLVQLKGIRANGAAELVSSYPFRGVIK